MDSHYYFDSLFDYIDFDLDFDFLSFLYDVINIIKIYINYLKIIF